MQSRRLPLIGVISPIANAALYMDGSLDKCTMTSNTNAGNKYASNSLQTRSEVIVVGKYCVADRVYVEGKCPFGKVLVV